MKTKKAAFFLSIDLFTVEKVAFNFEKMPFTFGKLKNTLETNLLLEGK